MEKLITVQVSITPRSQTFEAHLFKNVQFIPGHKCFLFSSGVQLFFIPAFSQPDISPMLH